MGSINRCHNETDGGILLYQGEPILLFADAVTCEIGGKSTVKGRIFLTTHRMVFTMVPYKPNNPVKSLSAPFCAITKINLEQPVFGANYIEATVTDEIDPTKTFSFKLKFSKGGAIEFARAMNGAVTSVGRMDQAVNRPPAYTPSPTDSFYQAPPTVYAPGYNCGVSMPTNQFPDQPPIGFIYTSSAPPPYPGLSSDNGQGGKPQSYPQGSTQYPQNNQQAYNQYPQEQGQYPQAQGQYPQAPPPPYAGQYAQSTGQYPQAGVASTGQYPQAGVAGTGQYPQAGVANTGQYPQAGVANTGQYPQASAVNTGQYPQASIGLNIQPASNPNHDSAGAPSAPSL